MQGLYQRHFSKSSITDIESEFIVDNDMSKVDAAYFRDPDGNKLNAFLMDKVT